MQAPERVTAWKRCYLILPNIVADDSESLPFLIADSILCALNCHNISKWPVPGNVFRQQSPQSAANPSFEAAAAALLCRYLWFASSTRFMGCQIRSTSRRRLAALESRAREAAWFVVDAQQHLYQAALQALVPSTSHVQISATPRTRIREDFCTVRFTVFCQASTAKPTLASGFANRVSHL